MSDYEIQRIARSAARYQPGNALTVSPEVLAAGAYLEERAKHRAKKGLAARAGLDVTALGGSREAFLVLGSLTGRRVARAGGGKPD